MACPRAGAVHQRRIRMRQWRYDGRWSARAMSEIMMWSGKTRWFESDVTRIAGVERAYCLPPSPLTTGS